jgi:hypothetical protein
MLSDFTIVYHPISLEVYQAERERRGVYLSSVLL